VEILFRYYSGFGFGDKVSRAFWDLTGGEKIFKGGGDGDFLRTNYE